MQGNSPVGFFVKMPICLQLSLEEFEKVETPIEWDIPDDYDFWSHENKKKLIIECLNEETEGYRGVKLSEFQSDLIGRFLYEA